MKTYTDHYSVKYRILPIKYAALVSAGFSVAMISGCIDHQFRIPAGSLSSNAQPMLIAHRGSSGYFPEHTLEAYTAAFFSGADMIEPDVVSTRDGHLICLHDITLESVTDVESRYPQRHRSDGHWYAIDFDLNEIKTMAVTGRNDQWIGTQIPTLEEMLYLVRRLNNSYSKDVGVVPELKKPSFHTHEGVDLVMKLREVLAATEWDTDRVIVQCFEEEALRRFGRKETCRQPLMLNLPKEIPSNQRLIEIAVFADGIGISRDVIEQDPTLVHRAQDQGLQVIAYTFNDEPGVVAKFFYEYKVDGLYANFPAMAQRVRLEHTKKKQP